jgi:localization factor PodJL
MVVNRSPWSVKGVDAEARGAAKSAARRAGLTIGSWLSQTIHIAATEQLTNTTQRHIADGEKVGQDPFSKDQNPESQYIPSEEYSSSQKLYPNAVSTGSSVFKNAPQSRLSNEYSQQPDPGYQIGTRPIPTPTMQELFDTIQLLNRRLERAELKTTATLEPIAKLVSQLSKQFDQVKTEKESSTVAVERSVMRIKERLDKMEKGYNKSARPQESWWRRNRD